MNEEFWQDMLGVLKDVSSYLEKQDATQERAKISTPPRIAENPKPIKGGDMPGGFKPADKIAKEFVTQDEAYDRDTSYLDSKGATLLKEDEDGYVEEDEEMVEEEVEEIPEVEDEYEEEEEVEEAPERYHGGEDESIDELKSLLKDIRNALVKKSATDDVMKEVKKMLPNMVKGESDKMLRKMGFIPTRPDVTRLDVSKSTGIDSNEEVKSGSNIKKSKDGEDIGQIVEDLSKKSWTELGQLREKTDGFHPFTR